MAQVVLQGLEPGTGYVVQIRAKSHDGKTSEWSTAYKLTTPSDITPPAPVTGFTWQVVGTSFKGKWTKPTTDANGKPLQDFKDYRVVLTANSITATYFVGSDTFDFTFEQNKASFNNVAQPSVQCEVRARDIAGNLSSPVSATATNPPPSNVTGLAVQGVIGGIGVAWNAVTDDDLKGYEVHISTSSGFTPSAGTLKYSGNGTGFFYPAVTPVTHYVKVRAVDIFNQPSAADASGSATPVVSTDTDVVAPNAPTNVTVTSAEGSDGQAFITVNWTAVAASDLDVYVVRWSKDGTVWQYSDVPSEATSARIQGVAPGTAYYVAAAAKDFSGNKSGWTNATTYPITTAKDTTGPSKPATPGISTGTAQVQVSVTGLKAAGGSMDADTDFYEVHASTTTGFTPSTSTLRGTIPVTPGVATSAVFSYTATDSVSNLYWKIVPVDISGNSGTASDQATGVPGLIAAANIADATITNAKIANIDANKINAGTAFVNDLNVRSNLTLDQTSGHIKSSNYNAGAQTGWTLDSAGLVIYDGSIAAKSLLLQDDTQNLIPPEYGDFEFASDYYGTTAGVLAAAKFNASTANLKGLVITSGPKFSNQCFRLYDTVVANGGTDTVYFSATGAAATSLNIDLTAGVHIISVWAKRTAAGGSSLRPGFYTDQATSILAGTAALAVSSGTWTRYSWTITVPVAVSKAKLFWQITAVGQVGFDVTIDGIQIERQLGASSTPSQFRPPSFTAIDGGQITTGSIKSTASAVGASGQPAWSLNAQGNAQLGDALVRGSLVVGAGSDLLNSVVQSASYDSGEAGWIIRGDGSAEFNNLTTRGNASGPSAGYDTISASTSFLYKGTELSDVIGAAPLGLIAYGWIPASTKTPGGTTVRGMCEISVPVKAGRAYKISWPGWRIWFIPAYSNCVLVLYYTTDGSQPTTSSASVWVGEILSPTTTNEEYNMVHPNPWLYYAATGGLLRVMSAIYFVEAGALSTIRHDPQVLYAEDIGVQQPNNGIDRFAGSAAGKQRYTFDIQPVDSRSYTGSGAYYPISGRGAAELMTQGDPGSNGNLRSLMFFNQTEINALIGVALADIEYCEMYVNFDHWWYTDGGTAFIGYHNTANVTVPQPAGCVPGLIQANWEGRDIGKWINVKGNATIMNAIRAGTFKGFMLGDTGSNNLRHYGYAHGASHALGLKPGFRCAYYK